MSLTSINILSMFLILRHFEPDHSYKKYSYKKNGTQGNHNELPRSKDLVFGHAKYGIDFPDLSRISPFDDHVRVGFHLFTIGRK